MPKYLVTYRGEFEAIVEAENEAEAERKFEAGEVPVRSKGMLWGDYLEVEQLDDSTKIKDLGG